MEKLPARKPTHQGDLSGFSCFLQGYSPDKFWVKSWGHRPYVRIFLSFGYLIWYTAAHTDSEFLGPWLEGCVWMRWFDQVPHIALPLCLDSRDDSGCWQLLKGFSKGNMDVLWSSTSSTSNVDQISKPVRQSALHFCAIRAWQTGECAS